jgi:hypothetical protein
MRDAPGHRLCLPKSLASTPSAKSLSANYPASASAASPEQSRAWDKQPIPHRKWAIENRVPISTLDKIAREVMVDGIFLDLLQRFASEGRNVSDKRTSNNYAPAAFTQEAEAKKQHLRKPDFEAAMRRLFKDRKIHVEQYGRPSRPASRIAIKWSEA